MLSQGCYFYGHNILKIYNIVYQSPENIIFSHVVPLNTKEWTPPPPEIISYSFEVK